VLILPLFVLVLMPLVCVNQQSDLRGLLAGSLTYLILFCVSKICKSNLVNVLKSVGNCMWKNVNELWKSVRGLLKQPVRIAHYKVSSRPKTLAFLCSYLRTKQSFSETL